MQAEVIHTSKLCEQFKGWPEKKQIKALLVGMHRVYEDLSDKDVADAFMKRFISGELECIIDEL